MNENTAEVLGRMVGWLAFVIAPPVILGVYGYWNWVWLYLGLTAISQLKPSEKKS